MAGGLINGRPGVRARAFIYYSRVFIIGGFAKRKSIQTERTFRGRNNDPNNHDDEIYAKRLFTRSKKIRVYASYLRGNSPDNTSRRSITVVHLELFGENRNDK